MEASRDRPLACIVLAAGQGTRMKSSLPKPLHRICGRTMLDHVLGTVAQIGARRTVVVVGAGAEQLTDAIDDRAAICVQVEQLGTGHAVMCAQEALGDFPGDVLVTYADVPLVTPETLSRLLAHHRETGAAATVLSTVVEDARGYGRVVRQDGRFAAIVEHNDATPDELAIHEINTGICVFEAAALWHALTHVTNDNAKGEFYLTDTFGVLAKEGRRVEAFVTEDPDEAMGVNTRVELAAAERIARDRVRTRVMLEGVTLIDPPSTFIDADVTIGRDTVIGPGCQLLGDTVVGEGCEIRSHVVLRSATIGDRVLLRDHTVIDTGTIGDDTQVGPFALVRGGSVIGPRCKLGSSAEVNRSRLGEGTKMQHFSYLGDATVGRNCNIGAGVITCNYDGHEKHPTVLEDDVFVGSDTILIAPVTIGKGAFTAAGSVITHDVPAGALGVARVRQTDLEGWAERRRQQWRERDRT